VAAMPPHSTQISAYRVTFSSLEIKKSLMGPNLENMVNGAAVRSAFDQFGRGDDGGVSQCVVMVKEHFFFAKWGCFFCNSASNRPNNSA